MSGKASGATGVEAQLLESLMMKIRPIYRSGGDYDLGATVAAQMYEVCDRLPAHVAQAALVRYGFVDAGMGRWRVRMADHARVSNQSTRRLLLSLADDALFRKPPNLKDR
jgi:hypothetical protein